MSIDIYKRKKLTQRHKDNIGKSISGKNNGMYGITGKNNPSYKKRIEWICPVCRTIKMLTPCAAKKRKFCSHKCCDAAGRLEETKEKIRTKTLEQFKNGMPQETKDKIGKSNIGKTAGEKHNSWCGFEYQGKRGRWYIWIDNIKYLRYRYVAEQCLHRKLRKEEIVHHINGDCSDDRPENLYVFESISKHVKHHRHATKFILTSNLIKQL